MDGRSTRTELSPFEQLEGLAAIRRPQSALPGFHQSSFQVGEDNKLEMAELLTAEVQTKNWKLDWAPEWSLVTSLALSLFSPRSSSSSSKEGSGELRELRKATGSPRSPKQTKRIPKLANSMR